MEEIEEREKGKDSSMMDEINVGKGRCKGACWLSWVKNVERVHLLSFG